MRSSKDTCVRHDYLAFFLVAISLLNLGGLLTTLTQAPGAGATDSSATAVYFALATPITIYMVMRYARSSAITAIFSIFAIFFIVYLAESTAYALSNFSFDPWDLTTLAVHTLQLILTCGVYFWLMQLDDESFAGALDFFKWMLVLGSLSIVCSSWLPMYQGGQVERAGGFYIDQNSAANVALYCLVLIATTSSVWRVSTLMQLGIALAALLLTFSRTGLISLFVLTLLLFVSRPSLKSALLALTAVVSAALAFGVLINSGFINLNFEQTQRLIDVMNLLTGETSQKTFDDRDILFDMGLNRISETFPWGAGLGEFHALEYGVRHRPTGEWLGVHNTYLMILGEAGIVSLMIFAMFWISLFFKLSQSPPFWTLALGVSVVLLLSMMTTHSVLNDKVAAVIMGLQIAAATRRFGMKKFPRPLLGECEVARS